MEALIGVVGEGEWGDDQFAGHGAELPAEPLHILADPLVPGANDRATGPRKLTVSGHLYSDFAFQYCQQQPSGKMDPDKGALEATRPLRPLNRIVESGFLQCLSLALRESGN